LWTPRKLREGKAREKVRKREEQELQLQKSVDKELKAAAMLYKKKIQETAKIAREKAKVVKEKEKAEKAAERELQKQARDSAKAIQLSQKGKRPPPPKTSDRNKVVVVQLLLKVEVPPSRLHQRSRHVDAA
jgi:hypothetical protein